MILFDGIRIYILRSVDFPHEDKLSKANAYLRYCCKWGGPDHKMVVNDMVMNGYEMPKETIKDNLVLVSAILGLIPPQHRG